MMSEYGIPDQATTAEIRKICKCTDRLKWQRFLAISREIAHNMVAENPSILWRNVFFNEKQRITATINDQLVKEDIVVEKVEFLVNWRMPKAIGSVKYAAKIPKGGDSTDTPNDDESATEQTLPPAEHGRSSRPYDPVRDI